MKAANRDSFRRSSSKATKDGPIGSERLPIVAVEELVPCCAILCFMTSLYISANCLGCTTKEVICCCYEEAVCCKVTREPGFNWICFKCEIMNASIGNCFQCDKQCFCLDARCSLPHFDENPCLLTICFCTCCYQYYCLCPPCCSNINKLDETLDEKITKYEKKAEVIRSAVGGDPVRRTAVPHSEFDDAERQSNDSFFDAEGDDDTVTGNQNAGAHNAGTVVIRNNEAVRQLSLVDSPSRHQFAGTNPTSKLATSSSSSSSSSSKSKNGNKNGSKNSDKNAGSSAKTTEAKEAKERHATASSSSSSSAAAASSSKNSSSSSAGLVLTGGGSAHSSKNNSPRPQPSPQLSPHRKK